MAFGSIETSSVNFGGRFPSVTNTDGPGSHRGKSQAGANHPADRSTASITDEIHVRDVGLSHQIDSILCLRVGGRAGS